MPEKDPAQRVTKALADYYSLHRNLRLDFINGKPKNAVEHLVSVINPATLKVLIESKLEMDKSDLKKDFLEFVAYLEKMAIIHVFCRPDQFSRNSYVDDNGCLLVSSLPSLF
jgi:hypothetical protein